jgi:hypothetical protein
MGEVYRARDTRGKWGLLNCELSPASRLSQSFKFSDLQAHPIAPVLFGRLADSIFRSAECAPSAATR